MRQPVSVEKLQMCYWRRLCGVQAAQEGAQSWVESGIRKP